MIEQQTALIGAHQLIQSRDAEKMTPLLLIEFAKKAKRLMLDYGPMKAVSYNLCDRHLAMPVGELVRTPIVTTRLGKKKFHILVEGEFERQLHIGISATRPKQLRLRVEEEGPKASDANVSFVAVDFQGETEYRSDASREELQMGITLLNYLKEQYERSYLTNFKKFLL